MIPGAPPHRRAAPLFYPATERNRSHARLDKWLKVSRLIKRRTVANEACDNGWVTANGRSVKASYEVKPGDVLELKFGERTVKGRGAGGGGQRGQGGRLRPCTPGGLL